MKLSAVYNYITGILSLYSTCFFLETEFMYDTTAWNLPKKKATQKILPLLVNTTESKSSAQG